MKILYCLYILLILILSTIPGSGPGGQGHMDKIGHLGAYFILAVFSLFIYKGRIIRIITCLGAIGLGFALEYLQSFIPGRTASVYDGILNTLGVICGVVLFKYYGHYLKFR